MFGEVDKCLQQAFPHHADEMLGGCSCLFFGDFGQLHPVMDLPLMLDQLSLIWVIQHTQCFDKAVVRVL